MQLIVPHCDEGRRFGHITTNLYEYINVILKGTRNLLVTAIVRETYERLQQLFVCKGRKAQMQLKFGEVYSQQLLAAIENRESLPKMTVTHYDRRASISSVAKTKPLEG
ncbi:hypothetical protein AHAS_Ahas19G0210300 [Arachis hypogaea]